jgi:hypothetical protein
MKRLLTLAVATAILGLTIDSVQARPDNPAIKNGNPCIEDVCINDELKDLGHIKWENLRINKERSREVKAIGNPAAIKSLGYYFASGYLDAKGIKELNKIKGFCKKPYELNALYTDKKGRDVVVTFDFLPTKDRKSQKFFVRQISQKLFNQTVTREQLENLEDQIKIKYPGFHGNYDRNKPSVSVGIELTYTSLLINSQYFSDGFSSDEYRKFPGCGGDVQIKL